MGGLSKKQVSRQYKLIIIEMSKERLLYFKDTGGEGKFICNACGHTEYIICYMHGFTLRNAGYQCQECCRFTSIVSEEGEEVVLKCDCGGDLSMVKPIFCPVCRSKNVSYRLMVIS